MPDIKSKPIVVETETESAPVVAQQTKGWKIFGITIQIIAPLIWVYTFSKLFVFDIDTYLFGKYLPQFAHLLAYKFLFVIGILAILIAITGNKYLVAGITYIIFYPFIIVFWKIPFFIYKKRSWEMAFSFINTLISFFQDFKFNFISVSVFIISVAACLFSSNKYVLYVGCIGILAIIATSYIRRFSLVFQPSRVFVAYKKFFPGVRKVLASSFVLDQDIKGIPLELLTDNQKQTWISNLQISVLHNRLCLFIARKLSLYQKSKFNLLSYIFSLFRLMFATIIGFSGIFYALYKINPLNFSPSGAHSYFDFFYYSFTNLLHGSSIINASLMASQTAYMLEVLFEVLLFTLLVSLFLSVRNEKYEEELAKVVSDLEVQGSDMEGFIKNEYSIESIAEALEVLRDAKAGLLGIILGITKTIE